MTRHPQVILAQAVLLNLLAFLLVVAGVMAVAHEAEGDHAHETGQHVCLLCTFAKAQSTAAGLSCLAFHAPGVMLVPRFTSLEVPSSFLDTLPCDRGPPSA